MKKTAVLPPLPTGPLFKWCPSSRLCTLSDFSMSRVAAKPCEGSGRPYVFSLWNRDGKQTVADTVLSFAGAVSLDPVSFLWHYWLKDKSHARTVASWRVTFSVGKADGVKPRREHAEGRLPQEEEEEERLTTASTIPALCQRWLSLLINRENPQWKVVCPIVSTFQILKEKFNTEISFYQISYNL